MKVFAFILSVAMLFGGAALADEPGNGDAAPRPAPEAAPLSSAVKVCMARDCSTGHGSGVHVGGGWFLTAAHVAENAEEFTLKAEDGRLFKATVVWISKEADLALMKIVLNEYQTAFNFPSSAVACRAPGLGEVATAIGNPHDIFFAHVDGYIAAGPQELGPWSGAFIFIMPVFGGFSGGPVYDDAGSVIGIVVGMLKGTSYSIIEPVNKLCELLPADVAVAE